MNTKITQEIGQAVGIRQRIAPRFMGGSSSRYEAQSMDLNPDLTFPNCLPVYQAMQTNSKIGGILQAITLRITSMEWSLAGDKVRPEVIEFLKEQLGLADKGSGRARHKNAGVNLFEHIEDAMTALTYGFAPFEQVYTIGAPVTPAEQALGLRWVTRLRKLAHRDPGTIEQIGVGRDGGLVDIVQRVMGEDGMTRPESIPVDRLVVYTNGRRGGDWYGRSILRNTYRDWYFVDMYERIHAQIVERNGMGFPTFEYDPATMTKEQAMEVVEGIRAGDSVGAVWPAGAGSFGLQGVTGSTADPMPPTLRHEQLIGKSMLAMFMDLGHDNGARALGDTFTVMFDSQLNAFADRFAETFTEHVIADLVALNFGPAELYPELVHGSASATIGADADTLKTLSDAGFITANREDESVLRSKLGMPEIEAVAPAVDDADAGMSADDFLKRVNAAAALIRSGFAPEESLIKSGLDPVKHLGLLPVTVQRPDTTDGDMPDGTNIAPAEDTQQPAPGVGLSASVLQRAAAILERAGQQ